MILILTHLTNNNIRFDNDAYSCTPTRSYVGL